MSCRIANKKWVWKKVRKLWQGHTLWFYLFASARESLNLGLSASAKESHTWITFGTPSFCFYTHPLLTGYYVPSLQYH